MLAQISLIVALNQNVMQNVHNLKIGSDDNGTAD